MLGSALSLINSAMTLVSRVTLRPIRATAVQTAEPALRLLCPEGGLRKNLWTGDIPKSRSSNGKQP